MTKIDDGGPAFPDSTFPSKGMTLRDWFAGMVLQGMHARDTHDPGLASPKQRAAIAYIDADAMLAERNKTPRHLSPEDFAWS